MKPLVSILIPAFNAERWIAATIRSAIGQSWEHKEVVVVDDGSRDSTLSIAMEFESAGVRVVTQGNKGPAATRNRALRLSQGDYIQWLDADDLLARDKIERQIESRGSGDGSRTLLSSAWGTFIHRPECTQFIPTALWADLTPAEWVIRKIGQNLYMQTATWLVSRELTEIAGPWDERLTLDDDGEYFGRILMAADHVKFVPESKVYYRESGPGSMSRSRRATGKLDSQWLSIQLQVGYLRSMSDDEHTKAVCLRYLQNWLAYFYPERPDIVEEAKRTAAELGGHLECPHLGWKYRWMEPVLGRARAGHVQEILPRMKWSVLSAWDKAMFLVTRKLEQS